MATGYPVKANYATGDVLTAANMNDLSNTVNLAVGTTPNTATQMAGKNKIINGDFGVWQRGTSFSTTSYGTFYADRWVGGTDGTGVTRTVSQQTFTPATAPVSGYEGTYYCRIAQTVAGSGAGYNVFEQRLEDVRVFAGQTVTLSFWAKAAATTSISTAWGQFFGSGGSSAVDTAGSSQSITTSWARYTQTFTVPSLSGKTIGTNSYVYVRFGLPVNATFTLDIWGVQVEAGSTATPFQTATGTIQGELAACQRYYVRIGDTNGASNQRLARGSANSTTGIQLTATLPVQLRTGASSTVDYANLQWYNGLGGVGSISSVTMSATSTTNPAIAAVTTGVVSGTFYELLTTSTAGYIGFSAEL